MKKTLSMSVAALLAVAALAGCSHSNYAIHTKDGRTIISDGKPQGTEAGLLGYIDANGTKQQINQNEVEKVSEVPR
ncbi:MULTISPECIES: YgdI/YgdR family lipoprotein [Erwinia]|uniref:YgdI/YgdR family lipoprotein n=1 Tax=Erwinia TaxID=551 RepID=UPI000550BE03|nr:MULTISPECIES: YgdI/YgdR family lipoprotein [Erwinia]